MSNNGQSVLSRYRVLDLTEGGCMIAGKLMADVGADVIKIERPSGSPSRSLGPFYHDSPHPERSLFWMAFNNKRGITLNLEMADGREIFKKLVKVSDFVIESFTPGYLENLGIGYDTLADINPRIILTSITPFGQSGPKSHYKSSELTNWASHGTLYITGYPDKPPMGMSLIHQGSLIGGLDGVVGSLIAHWSREASGEGQHVDVSMQECGITLLQAVVEYWNTMEYVYSRSGVQWKAGQGVGRRLIYSCKDGHVVFFVAGGSEGLATSTRNMLKWMDEDGMAPDWLKKIDWVTGYDYMSLTQDDEDRMDNAFAKFIATKTQEELFQKSLQEQINLAPVENMAGVADNPQLISRDFWVKMNHLELGDDITYCGAFAKFSETPCQLLRHAPHIGEHNEEIYRGILGMAREDMVTLKQLGAI
ncbi:CaiB/BaiF CoA transferase family protein [Chloroflexota bacterium]